MPLRFPYPSHTSKSLPGFEIFRGRGISVAVVRIGYKRAIQLASPLISADDTCAIVELRGRGTVFIGFGLDQERTVSSWSNLGLVWK